MGIEHQRGRRPSAASKQESVWPWRRRLKRQPESAFAAEPLWAAAERWVGRALKISGSVGTVIAMTYFLRIGKTPIDGLASLAGIALAIAFVAFSIFGAMVVLWGAPTLLFRWAQEVLPTVVFQWFERRGQVAAESESAVSKASWRRTWIWCSVLIGAPWLAVFAFAMPTYFGGCQALEGFGWGVGVCALMFGLWLAFEQKLSLKNRAQRLGFAVFYSISSGYPLLAVFPLIQRSSVGGASGVLQVWVPVFTVIVAVVCANVLSIAFALVPGQTRPARWVAGVIQMLIVTGVLLGVTTVLGAWSSLQNLVMELASVRIANARIVLDKSACQFIDSRNIEPLPASGPGAVAPEGCVLKRATILFSVGSRWPIQFDATQGADVSQVLLLKSDSVVRVETLVPKERPSGVGTVCRPAKNGASGVNPTSSHASSVPP